MGRYYQLVDSEIHNLNREALRRVIDLIESTNKLNNKTPDADFAHLRFNMPDYIADVINGRTDGHISSHILDGNPDWCGTACCIAGYAVEAKNCYPLNEREVEQLRNPVFPELSVFHIAATYIGLPLDAARVLFNPDLDCSLNDIRAEDAVEVLQHLLAHNTIDWRLVEPRGVERQRQRWAEQDGQLPISDPV